MNLIKEKMLDEKITAALINGLNPDSAARSTRIEKVASNVRETSLEKIAGMLIDNPTLENCEDYVRRYMTSELAVFPKLIEFSINIIPSAFSTDNEDFITDASGMVRMKIHSKTIEIPFLLYSGELVPFDLIQMDGQRIPYSRENLLRVLQNVTANEETRQAGAAGDSPYVGLAEHYNGSTVPGFMGEVLSIRDTHAHRSGIGSMYVTASEGEEEEKESFTKDSRPVGDRRAMGVPEDDEKKEVKKKSSKEEKKAQTVIDLDELLDIAASIAPMSDNECYAFAQIIEQKAYNDYKERFEKTASSWNLNDLTEREERKLEKKAKQKLSNLADFKNGDFIAFPELSQNGISMTPAIVFETSRGKMVLTQDRRYEMVKNHSEFICGPLQTEFKIKMGAVNQLEEGSEFILLVGDKAEPVQTVRHTKSFLKHDKPLSWDIETDKHLPKCLAKFIYYSEAERDKAKVLCMLNNGSAVTSVSAEECAELVARDNGMTEGDIRRFVPEFRYLQKDDILAVNPKTPLIFVTSRIATRITSNKQLDSIDKLHQTGHEIGLETEKVAFSLNSITVLCKNRKMKVFDLAIEYKDSSARMMTKRRRDFNNISIGKLKAILYMLKYDGQVINDIIYKAKTELKAEYPLPYGCSEEDIANVFGGNEEVNVSKETIKNTVSKFVNPNALAKGVASAATVALLADAGTQHILRGGAGSAGLQKAMTFAGNIMKGANEVATEFEKIAIANESEIYLDYAKTMALTSLFAEKIAMAIDDEKNTYPSIKDMSRSILAAKPVFEKLAHNMTKEKYDGLKGENIANMAVLGSGVLLLDRLHKLAYEVDKSLDLTDMKFM